MLRVKIIEIPAANVSKVLEKRLNAWIEAKKKEGKEIKIISHCSFRVTDIDRRSFQIVEIFYEEVEDGNVLTAL